MPKSAPIEQWFGEEQEAPEGVAEQTAGDDGEQERVAALEAEAMRLRFAEDPKTIIKAIIPTSRVVQDQQFQIRAALNAQAVAVYRRRYSVGAEMPPIEVASVDGVLHLIDGWHRLEALRQLERYEVEVRIRELASIDEARYEGGVINSKHGVHLTRDEREALFKLYVRTGKHFIPGKPQDNPRWIKSYRMERSHGDVLPRVARPSEWIRLAASTR